MIAFVRSVIRSATWSGSMFRSESRTSAKTGVAPAWTITFAVAGQVIGDVITSSPGSTPTGEQGEMERGGAGRDGEHVLGLDELREAPLELRRFRPGRQPARAKRLRNGLDLLLADRGRLEAEHGGSSFRRDFDTDLEANETLQPLRPGLGLLPARSRGQDGSGPVRASQEGPEDVSRLAVDTDAADPFDATRLFDAFDLPQDSSGGRRGSGRRRRRPEA